jgi:hypothetical protein
MRRRPRVLADPKVLDEYAEDGETHSRHQEAHDEPRHRAPGGRRGQDRERDDRPSAAPAVSMARWPRAAPRRRVRCSA